MFRHKKHNGYGGFCDRCGTYGDKLIRDGYAPSMRVHPYHYLPAQSEDVPPIQESLRPSNPRPEVINVSDFVSEATTYDEL